MPLHSDLIYIHQYTCSLPPIEIDKRLVQKEDVYFYKFMYQLQTLLVEMSKCTYI